MASGPIVVLGVLVLTGFLPYFSSVSADVPRATTLQSRRIPQIGESIPAKTLRRHLPSERPQGLLHRPV